MMKLLNVIHLIAAVVFAISGVVLIVSFRLSAQTLGEVSFVLVIAAAVVILIANVAAALAAAILGGDKYWKSYAPLAFALLAGVFGLLKAANAELWLSAAGAALVGAALATVAGAAVRRHGGVASVIMLAMALMAAEAPAYDMTTVTAVVLPLLAGTSLTVWLLAKRGSD